MLALGPGIALALAPEILLRSLPGQDMYYAFNVATGDQFRLNQTSFWILENIGSGIQWVELRARFLEAFDASPTEADADLQMVVSQFVQEHIMRRVTNGEAEDGI